MIKKVLIFCFVLFFSIIFISAFGFPRESTTNEITILNGTEFEHNDLQGIQGGTSNEYYHLTNTIYSIVIDKYDSWIENTVNDLTNYFTKTKILEFNYYNVTDFNISDYIPYTGANQNIILGDNNFSVNGTTFHVDANTGNVGIGTTSPTQKLEVNGAINTTNLYVGDDLTIYDDLIIGGEIVNQYDSNTAIYLFTDNLQFYAGGEKMINLVEVAGQDYVQLGDGGDIDINLNDYVLVEGSSGYVGIGTATPVAPLELSSGVANGDGGILKVTGTGAGTSANIRFQTVGGYGLFQLDYDGNMVFRGDDDIYFDAEGSGTLNFRTTNSRAIKMKILNNGNVGIGTTSPTYPLTVFGNVSGISIWADGNISASDYITRTSVYESSKGSVWDYIKNTSYYLTDNKIDHSKFYGYAGKFNITDMDRPVEEEKINEVCEEILIKEATEECSINEKTQEEECIYIEAEYKTECHNETETITTYPYEKETEGVSLNKEIDVLRQAVYELKTENDDLKTRLDNLEEIIYGTKGTQIITDVQPEIKSWWEFWK